MKELNGGCHSVIGIYSEIKNNDLYLLGTFDVGNGTIVKKDIVGDISNYKELGISLAEKIMKGY